MAEIEFDKSGGIARVRLNTPDRHNALTREDLESFLDHLCMLENDSDCRVLIITGAGDKTFCSGASLEQIRTGMMSGALFETLADRLAALPIPKIAAMNGSAYGGGVEIGLCCDFRIGVRGIKAVVPAACFGLFYPGNGIRRYVNALGPGTAKRLLVAAEPFDAEELVRVGYLHRLTTREELTREAENWAQRISGLAPLAVRAMLQACDQAADGSWNGRQVRSWTEACEASGDLQEGLRAAAEKRKPVFRGR
jgi:enoyl-CoA hydratase/carnithine racemase